MISRDTPAVTFPKERRQARASIRRFYSGLLPRVFLSFFLPLLPVLPAAAQEATNVVTDSPDKPALAVPAKSAVVSYDSNNLRDPFFHITPKASPQAKDAEISRGTPPPGIAGTFIDKAGLEGIVIRSDNQRTAVIRGADNRAYFLREGDRLFDGYLKTIKDDSVVFIRETRMQSGKTLTQEVTKQLRKS